MKRTGIFSQRLPFAGLLIAGVLGILVAQGTSFGAWVFLSVTLLALGIWVCNPRTLWCLLAVGAGFATAHVWSTREGPAEKLATLVGDARAAVTLEGVVLDEPSPFGQTKMRFALRASRLELGGTIVNPGSDFLILLEGPAPRRGDRVRLTGALQRVPTARNPTEFDARAWMWLRGITCEVSVENPNDLYVIEESSPFSLLRLADASRAWLESTLQAGISDDPVVSHLILGMVLGITREIPEALQEAFRETGTFHLFSVSGLHVGMIALIFWQALRLAGVPRGAAVMIIVPLVFFYALLTGWKPASVRAASMAAIFLLSFFSSRQPVPANSLCAAGFLILAQQTREVFNPGFQLSFLVVLSILLISPPIDRVVRSVCTPDPFLPRSIWNAVEKALAMGGERLAGLFAVSLAAWLGSLPLILAYFHLISFSALIVNMIVVPLAFVIMLTALISAASGVVSLTLAVVWNNANWVFVKVLIGMVTSAAAIPGSFVYLGAPSQAPVVITVFDCEGGSAIGIEVHGRLWLIDTGPAFFQENVVRPWLKSRGRSHPEALILSHGDARHIGGGLAFLEDREEFTVFDSPVADRSPTRRRFHQELASRGFPKSIIRTGDRLPITAKVWLDVLHPPAGLHRNEADDKVMVLRMTADKWRVLFLSDAGLTTQKGLLETRPDELRAEVLVMGRHRSGHQMDRSFLQAVAPKVVITTAATFPKHEVLDPAWEEMVRGLGIRLIRQDRSGAVEMELQRETMRLRGFLDGYEFEQRRQAGSM